MPKKITIREILHTFAITYRVESKEKRQQDINKVKTQIKQVIDSCVPRLKVPIFVNCSKHDLQDDYSKCPLCDWEISPEQADAHNDCIADFRSALEGIWGEGENNGY